MAGLRDERLLLAEHYLGGLAHVHTKLSNHPGHTESDQTVSSWVKALAKAGLAGDENAPVKFLVITEHASDPARPRSVGKFSLRARTLRRQEWRRTVKGVPVLYGFEASLMPDGSTDLPEELAQKAELVIASRHGALVQDPEATMATFELGCRNPVIDVLGHPARYIEGMKGLDWPQVFAAAAESGTAVEINLNSMPDPVLEPMRVPFWQKWLAQLAESDAWVFVGTDLHNGFQFGQWLEQWQTLGRRDNKLGASLEMLDAAGIAPDRVVTGDLVLCENWAVLAKDSRARAAREQDEE